MGMDDLVKRTLKNRRDIWPRQEDLPDFEISFRVDVATVKMGDAYERVDGMEIEVRRSQISLGDIPQTFGQAFFQRFCHLILDSGGPSYDDAKKMATAVAEHVMESGPVAAWITLSE